jgi:hypothetical protein
MVLRGKRKAAGSGGYGAYGDGAASIRAVNGD